MLIPIQIGTGKQVVKKKKVSTVTPEEQAKAFDILRKQTSKDIAYEEKKQAELEANLRKRTVDPATNRMVFGEAPAEMVGLPKPQAPKVAPTPKVTKEGLVKKVISTKFGDIDYTATPEESQIFKSGDINAINNLMREIALDFEKGGEEQGLKPKTTTTEKYTFDTVDAGLQENFVAKKTKEILNQTFKALMPAPVRMVSDVMESAGQGLQKKGQELMQSDSSLGKIGGFLTTAAGGILEDASNPLATFTAGTGNLYDPTATMEERVGAGINVVGYALGAMNPLEAAGSGIKAFRAGATGTEALTTAGRSLLRSSVPFGKKIDTALGNKASLKNLIDVLEAEGQMMGKTRAALTKDFVDAGKTYAKETGKTAEEFYTKYLNDFAEGKGQLTSPGRVPPPIIEPSTAPAAFELPSTKAPQAPETPVIPEPQVSPAPVVESTTSVIPEPIAQTQNPDIGIYKISADKADEIDLQYGDDLQQAYVNKYPDATDAELTDIQNNDFREWKKQNPNASLESFYEEQIPKLDPYWQPAIHPKVKLPATPDAIRQIQNIAPAEKAISKLEDLPKEAKAIEQWTENNLLGELLPSDPNFDVRKADAVGQHYGIGNFPRDTSFDEWYEDLKNAIETQSQNRVLDELTDTSWLEDARNELYRIIYGSKDKSTSPFGKQWIQNNPQRIIQLRIYDKRANKSLIPTRATKRFVSLADVPAFMREDLLGRVRDDDFVYMTAADYARWKSEGASAFGGTIKPKRMSDFANYKGDFYDDAPGLDEVSVPLEVVKEKYAELNAAYKKSKEGDKFAKYTPTKKDLERAFDNYFDANAPKSPTVEPTPTAPTWDAPGVEDEVRATLTNYLKQRLADKNYSDEYIQNLVSNVIAKRAKGVDDNPFFIEIVNKKTGATEIIDPRTGQPTKKLISELQSVEPPTSVIPEPTVTPAVEPTPTIEPPVTEAIPPVEPTSIKNEAMARDLKEMGFDDLPETQKQTFNEFLNEAEQRGLTQQTALDNILKDFEDGKVRQLDKAETLAMAKHAAELKNRIRDLRVRFRENPTGALADEIATAQERFNTVAGAVKRAGAEQAKALVARKAFLDKDYDVTSVLSEAAEARMAGKTSAQIRAEAEKIAKRTGESVDEVLKNGLHSKKEIEILTKRAEEAEKAAAEANAAKEALKKDLEDGLLAQQRAAKRTARTKENARARAEVAKKDFLALASKATAGLDPTLLKPLAQFIKAKIDEGVIILKGEGAIDQVVDILKKEGLDVDAVDVADALQFDRLNNRRPLSDLQKEKQRLLADLRAEAKKISPDSAEQMAKDEATKQRIRDRIAALDEQIKSGNYLEKVPKEVRQRDEEIVRLKAIEKLKKKKVDQELAKLAPKTGVAKVTNAIRSSKLAVLASRISDVAGNATAGVSKIVEVPVKYAVDKLTSTVLNELPINRVSSDNLGRMNNSFRRAALKLGYEWKGDIGELGGKTLGEKASNFLQNFGSVLSGMGDAPFKSLYFEIGADFGADLKARKLLGKGASELDIATLREDILRNIDEYPDVEMSATNFALQQTFNNDNVVSKIGGDVKRGVKQRFGLDKGTAAADAVDFALDELAFQFSKVITNVGAQAFDYVVPGGGIARGSLNLALAKAAKKAGKDIPWEQRDAINQMFARGLTSLAVGTAVTAIAPKLLPNRIVGEKGKEYIDFGDYQRLGGLSLPILVAIADSQLETYRNEDDEPFTDKQKADIKSRFLVDLALSNPLASNTKDILDVLDSNGNMKATALKFIAKKASNMVIPGQVRDWAKRQEATGPMGMMTGQEKIRSKFKVWDPEEGKRGGVKSSDDWRVIFGDEFKSKLPRTIFNPNFNRQTLPLKGQEEEALRP